MAYINLDSWHEVLRFCGLCQNLPLLQGDCLRVPYRSVIPHELAGLLGSETCSSYVLSKLWQTGSTIQRHGLTGRCTPHQGVLAVTETACLPGKG